MTGKPTFEESLKQLRTEFRTGHATLAELTQTPPEDIESTYAVGLQMLKMGKDREAVQVFSVLTVISCYDIRFWRALGLALYKTKRAKFAVTVLDCALCLDENDLPARTYRAEALLVSGRRDEAKQECEWVIARGTAPEHAPFVARVKALVRYTKA